MTLDYQISTDRYSSWVVIKLPTQQQQQQQQQQQTKNKQTTTTTKIRNFLLAITMPWK